MLRGRGGVVGGEAAGVRTAVSLSMALLSPPSATPVSSACVWWVCACMCMCVFVLLGLLAFGCATILAVPFLKVPWQLFV